MESEHPDRFAVRGTPVPLFDDVAYSRTFGHAHLDVGHTGMLVYSRSPSRGQLIVQWIHRDRTTTPLLTQPGRYNWLRLSPNGGRLALSAAEAGMPSIRGHDLASGSTLRMPATPHESGGLTWAPQGDRVLFGTLQGMAWAGAESFSVPQSLWSSETLQVPWSISPDGGRLAFYELNPATGFDLWPAALSATQDGLVLSDAEPFLRTPAYEVYPSFSPDGRRLAYASNESGTYEIYVRRFPDDGSKVRVSQGGGSIPRWSPNGREILYQTGDQRLMVASYRVEEGSFLVDAPGPWTSQRLGDTGVLPGFDIALDGERVAALMPPVRPEDRQAQNHVTIVLNVFDEVERRVGGRGRD